MTAAPNTPMQAVRCQPRSNVEASAIRHETSRPRAIARMNCFPSTAPNVSATARPADKTETPGWIEPRGIVRVVEVQRMPHTRVQQGRLGCRQAAAAQQDPALLAPTPVIRHLEQRIDPWRSAATEHAAERVEDIAFG